MNNIHQIGMGGGCHWCTEAIFASLHGVVSVEQGWMKSELPHDTYSEAVLISYDPKVIGLLDLMRIHLLTHSSASTHTMRHKYRSAVYYLTEETRVAAEENLRVLKQDLQAPVITQVLKCAGFKASPPNYRDYYYADPDRPFCDRYIRPKLSLLLNQFRSQVDENKILQTMSMR